MSSGYERYINKVITIIMKQFVTATCCVVPTCCCNQLPDLYSRSDLPVQRVAATCLMVCWMCSDTPRVINTSIKIYPKQAKLILQKLLESPKDKLNFKKKPRFCSAKLKKHLLAEILASRLAQPPHI